MVRPKILVTGATGKTGAAVIAQLIAKGYPVRARDPRSDTLERGGAEVVVADLFDPDQLLEAAKGTHRAYYLPPIHPYVIQSAVAFSPMQLIVVRNAALMDIFLVMGGFGAAADTSKHATTKREYGFVRLHMKMIGDLVEKHGLFLAPGGAKHGTPTIATRDVAEMIVGAALYKGTDDLLIEASGPEWLTWRQIADIIGERTGRTIRIIPLPAWLARFDQRLATPFSKPAANIFALMGFVAAYQPHWHSAPVVKRFGLPKQLTVRDYLDANHAPKRLPSRPLSRRPAMKLYSVPLSPFAARVRLSIYRKGLEDRIEIVRPPESGTRSEAFLALNPTGQVPTLELDSGFAIPESAAILEYLADTFPQPSLRPADPERLARARLFMRLPDTHFQNAPRILLGMRDPASRKPEVVEEAFGHLNRGLSYIDHFLEGGDWAVGNRASIADSAIVPTLNAVTLVGQVYQQPDLPTKYAKFGRYWEAARAEPVNARVIGEQLATVTPAPVGAPA